MSSKIDTVLLGFVIHIEIILLTGRCLDVNHYSYRDSFCQLVNLVSLWLFVWTLCLGADRYFLVNYDLLKYPYFTYHWYTSWNRSSV